MTMRRTPMCLFVLVLSAFLFSQQARATSADDCLACHGDASLKTEKKGRSLSLFVDRTALERSPHAGMNCTDCHVGFDPTDIPHAKRIHPVDCTTCHSDVRETHLFHASMNGAGPAPDASSCKACHGTHAIVAPSSRTADGRPRPGGACEKCHGDIVRQFLDSEHGRAASQGAKGAPKCVSCHQHPITSARADDSARLKLEQERLCLSCHLDDPDVRARMNPSAGFIEAYETSVHGAALLKGNAAAANCVDCHGAHVMKHGADPASPMSKARVPETCAHCHVNVASDYSESVHGKAVARGSKEAPVCTDCHGEHDILKHNDPKSPVAVANVSAKICTPCHSSVRISEKYGIPKGRPQSFSDSYHGLAIRGGSLEAANCASCHGSHKILPSNDPASSINGANLVKTCGKCHPGANERFAIGAVHVTTAKADSPVLYWIALLYILVIVGTIGGMFAHNLLDFVRKWRRKILVRRGVIVEKEAGGHALYLRMTVLERIQHATVIVSFTVLVVTGFMLSYPDAWWVATLRRLWGGVFDLRSQLHRIAAVVMVTAGVFHVGYMTLTTRGRVLLRGLLPRRKDVSDIIGTLRYNSGMTSVKPRYGKYSYIEKAEYWALVWGTGVMALTGVIMWFENTSMGFVTKLGWDISRTVHFYEAWLATLAILVWHIYYVVVNPDVYPMNIAWLTGTLTEKEMLEEHPLELEEIRGQAKESDKAAGETSDGKPEKESTISREQSGPIDVDSSRSSRVPNATAKDASDETDEAGTYPRPGL